MNQTQNSRRLIASVAGCADPQKPFNPQAETTAAVVGNTVILPVTISQRNKHGRNKHEQ
jgi:hypothetical protein